MRTLGTISTGVALLGILAYFLLKDAAPSYVVPVVIVSSVLAVFFLLVGIILSSFVGGRKSYQCVNCGTKVTGGDPVRIGKVCPNCGGNVFALVK
jgi:DNA-directed RNA polymerase subunit RPC12/RpoP